MAETTLAVDTQGPTGGNLGTAQILDRVKVAKRPSNYATDY